MTASLAEAHDRISHVEQAEDLLRHQVEGWAAWPLLRFEVSLLAAEIRFPGARSTGRAARVLRALGDLPRLVTVRPARYLVKTYSSGLIEQSGDRYRDVWFDDVIADTGPVFKIEAANSAAFAERSRHALVKRNISSAALEIRANLLARRAPSPEVTPVARQIGRTLREQLGLGLITDDWVARRLQGFVASKRVYGGLLRRVRPACVLVADPGEHALVAAAREYGAITVELQHGIVDASNAGYNWSAYAVPYRPRMPVPDRLLLWGEHWRREIAGGGFWSDSLRVVGSPRLDRFRAVPVPAPAAGGTMLFTTQGLDVDKVTAFLRACLEDLERRGSAVGLVIKLHPIHDADRGPYLRALAAFVDRGRVEVVAGDTGISTFELIRRAHVHVSIASASHYEAIGLGVPTVILPFQSHESVMPLHRAGHAHFAPTPEALADIVLGARDLQLSDAVREYYFQSGARARIRRELDPTGIDGHPRS